MKRITVLSMIMALLLTGCSFSRLKSYDTGVGLELYLPSGFEAYESEDFVYAASNDVGNTPRENKVAVRISFESDDALKAQGLNYQSVEEYGEALSKGEKIRNSAGMVDDRYVYDCEYDDVYYKFACIAGNEGYYTVSFCCYSDSEKTAGRFDDYISRIKVRKTGRLPDYVTYDNPYFTIDLPSCFAEDEENLFYCSGSGKNLVTQLSFKLISREICDEQEISYPASEKEAVEIFREYYDDSQYEIIHDGDAYYYVYREEGMSGFVALKKASDSYLYCCWETPEDMEEEIVPLFVKWFKSIKVSS